MATLDTYFSGSSAMTEVTRRVAVLSHKIETGEVDLNDGIRSSKELVERADKGAKISFDHARLLQEAEQYE